jgi:hypothetical protein
MAPPKVEDNWLCHTDMTSSKPEVAQVALACFGRIVAEKPKGKMDSIGGDEDPTAWCD